MYAILNLVTNTIMTGFAFVGIGTFIIKIGNFFRIIEENKEDAFKKGFDTIMSESIDEMNTCVESISIITNNFNKIFFILYDILVGNKFIKKDKDGKIIICIKSKMYSGFKDKIEELNSKVKKYQQELNKMKKNKKVNNDNDNDSSSSEDNVLNDILNDDDGDDDDNDDEKYSDVSSTELTDDEKDNEFDKENKVNKNIKDNKENKNSKDNKQINKQINKQKKNNDDEFYLE
jgi:hypothetical protein